MSLVLVTGASGFIGASLVPALLKQGHSVRALFRTAPLNPPAGADVVVVSGDWRDALRDVSAVVHLAGPAHAKYADDYLQREIASQSARLAEQAEQAGVTRFVFMSSIKAAAATSEQPLKETDTPAPADAYGRAKLKAEKAVLARPALRPVVLRPPLVCAANAKANFARLLRLAETSWPLPLAGVRARRSIIGAESLIEAVQRVLENLDGPAGVFHVAEQSPLTVAEMVTALRAGMGKSAAQFSLPGIGAILPASLRQSLVVDDAAFRAAYGRYGGADAREVLKAIGAAWASR